MSNSTDKHRILVIDDNPAIHNDIRKILGPSESNLKDELEDVEASLFGDTPVAAREMVFEIDSAFQGQEGLAKVRAAAEEGRPYAVAFVDVRMPPGWDGIETITQIWKESADLQIVICTAYSDYSWDDISKAIGNTDHILVLKKPFDNVEVLQMAYALSRKWELSSIAQRQMQDLDALVNQRTAELRAANERLRGEVSERAAAEAALRLSEERFSKAFHGSPVPMAIRSPDSGAYLDANASFVSLLGGSRETVLASGKSLWSEAETDAEIAAKLATEQALRDLAASLRTVSGETRKVLVAAQTLILGERPYHLLILQDITGRTRLEEELRQAQKMEAVGRLAAGVAHDFNNILTVILGNTSLQLRNPHLDHKMSAALQQVVLAAERATALTRQLLAYSRKQILQRRPIALNQVVEQTVGMLRRLIGEHIVVETNFIEELPLIFADATNVDQVVMNLALNARDAMPDGGRLTLSSARREINEEYCLRHLEAHPGNFVCLSVKDSGLGMDQATLARIFEPFFTTKEQGKGTGMGMATVYGVLKQHNGWVEVESALGRGTVIHTFFPVCEEDAGPAERPEVAIPALQPRLSPQFTILVVEDEPLLRDFVGDALVTFGYRVLMAANGPDALEIWKTHRDEVDLLLTDMVMPESISGRELTRLLVADKPELKVIFTSGYSPELLGAEFEQEAEYGFLPKPYLTDSLAQKVASHLAMSC